MSSSILTMPSCINATVMTKIDIHAHCLKIYYNLLMDNKSNYRFMQFSLPAVEGVISRLYECIWEKVADKAVAQLSKQQVKRDAARVCQDFILFSFDKANDPPKISDENEPKGIAIDEWGRFNVGIDERHSLEPYKRTNTIITMNSTNRNRRTTAIRKASDHGDIQPSKIVKEDVFVRVVPQDPVEPEQDKLRNAYLTEERMRIQELTSRTKQEAFEKTQKQMQVKFSKDKKPITFDYNGKVLNLEKEGAAKKPLMSTMGMNVGKDGEIVKKVELKALESEKIQNTRTTFNKRSTNRSQMLAKVQIDADGQKEIIQDQSQIQSGVKVIELKGNSQNIRQNKQRIDQNYLKYRLRDFKDYIKQRKFKQHSLKLKNIDSPQKQYRSIVQIQSQSIIPDGRRKGTIANGQQIKTRRKQNNQSKQSILISDASNSQVFLPEISFNQNQRSSKYFEQIGKDKHKSRVKSVKVDNQHLLSSFYYKNQKSSSRSKASNNRADGSSININEPVFNQIFDDDVQAYY